MGLDWHSLRMRRSADFERVRKEGRTHSCREFVLGVLTGVDSATPKAGFISSRRIGGAIERNRARRRLRALVRKDAHRLRPGTWIVLIARSACLTSSFRELQKSWDQLADRAGILHTS